MNSRVQSAILVLFALFLAISLLSSEGTSDTQLHWLKWMSNLDQYGLVRGYEANQADYPPLSSIILFALVRISQPLGISMFVALKLCLLLLLVVSSLLFWLWTRSFILAIALQLALTLSCMGLTLVDIFFAPSLILALWALQARKLTQSAFWFSVAFLTKWQPLIIAPFVVVYWASVEIRHDSGKTGFKKLGLTVLLPASLTVAACLAVFGGSMILSLQRAFSHAFLSGNALNLGWVLTYFLRVLDPAGTGGLVDGVAAYLVTDDWRYHALLKGLFFAAYLLTFLSFLRREKTLQNLLLYSLVGYLSYYILSSGVHENHMFPVVILSAALVAVNRAYLLTFLSWAFAANLNLFLFWGVGGNDPPPSRVVGVDIALPLSFLYIFLFLGLFLSTIFSKLAGASPVVTTAGCDVRRSCSPGK